MTAMSEVKELQEAVKGLQERDLKCYIEAPRSVGASIRAALSAELYDESGVAPTNILYCDRPGYVNVKIDFTGCDLARLLCLNWCIKVSFESIGAGPEFNLPVHNVKQSVCQTPYVEQQIRIPAFPECDKCGVVYLMVVTVTSSDLCGKPAPFGGFCKTGAIMVYPGDAK